MALAKALLQALKPGVTPPQELSGPENRVEAHFNPQTLTVSYSIAGTKGSSIIYRQKITQGAVIQQTGYNATVEMDLLFDTTETGKDVRNTTLNIAAMIKQPPQKKTQGQNTTSAPPVTNVRFSWGTFIFYGSIQSMTETLDFFSEQGVPLRATVHLSMNEVSLERNNPSNFTASLSLGLSASVGASASIGASASVGFSASASLSAGIDIGTTPLTLSQAGDTLQGLADSVGAAVSWKAIASANNIDNPRLIPPGTVLNLNASASASIGPTSGN